MSSKNKLLYLSAIFALGLSLLSCQDHQTLPVTLKATLDGKSVKPLPITSSATGMFTGKLDLTTYVLDYSLSYSGLSAPAVAAHLHKATGANGTGLVDITLMPGPTGTSGNVTGTIYMLRPGQVDSLIAGFYYVDLHTAAYPGGEIRGEVIKQ